MLSHGICNVTAPDMISLSALKRFTIRWDSPRAQYLVSEPCYDGGEVVNAEAYDALAKENAQLRKALRECRDFLTDPRIGTYTYMEGSDFYSDKSDVVETIDAVLGVS